MKKNTVTLDVREEIRRGREPFSKIVQAASALNECDNLLLIAPFEPAPLFRVLGQQGFSHQAKRVADDHWEVLFSRDPFQTETPESTAPAAQPKPSETCTGTPVVEVDACGLEPPQPLVTILEALATLPAGAHLRARTDRRPMHLYPQLLERGFIGQTEEQPDGSFTTYVRPR